MSCINVPVSDVHLVPVSDGQVVLLVPTNVPVSDGGVVLLVLTKS